MFGKMARKAVVADLISTNFNFRSDRAFMSAVEPIIAQGLRDGECAHDTAARVALDALNCLHYHKEGAACRSDFLRIAASIEAIADHLTIDPRRLRQQILDVAEREQGSDFAERVSRELGVVCTDAELATIYIVQFRHLVEEHQSRLTISGRPPQLWITLTSGQRRLVDLPTMLAVVTMFGWMMAGAGAPSTIAAFKTMIGAKAGADFLANIQLLCDMHSQSADFREHLRRLSECDSAKIVKLYDELLELVAIR